MSVRRVCEIPQSDMAPSAVSCTEETLLMGVQVVSVLTAFNGYIINLSKTAPLADTLSFSALRHASINDCLRKHLRILRV